MDSRIRSCNISPSAEETEPGFNDAILTPRQQDPHSRFH